MSVRIRGQKGAGVVFVTGADRGLGLSLARCFLDGGFRVLAGTLGPASDLAQLAARVPERLTAVPLDVTSPDSILQAAEATREAAGSLDVLVNNAGVHLEPQAASLDELDLADGHLERTMAVNAFGALRLTQQLLPMLRRGRLKLIVNISSETGSIADCWRDREFAYCMSKAALNMQTRLLHNYLAADGFRVLALHPGWMRTEMGGQDADISPEHSAERILALILATRAPQGPIYLDYEGKPLRW